MSVFYIFCLFAMTKNQRIVHDHEAPFWHLLVVLLLLGNQVVTQPQNKLLHGQHTLDPKYFYRF